MYSKLMRSLMCGALASGMAMADDGWTNLLKGNDLDGWVKRGGEAPYAVEDGAIVGTAITGTPNTFLCTGRDYADFILEYDFKVDPRLNSGVQIRSQSFPEPTTIHWEGQKIKVPANRVHGYQVEIDPSDRGWAVGLFDEACRKWLYPGMLGGDKEEFSKQGVRLFKQGDWNHVRIEAIGGSIKTMLNGEVRATIQDSRVPSGFIGLQVHSIHNKALAGAQVSWRNLRIKDLGGLPNTLTAAEKAAGWRLLWDGETNSGWRSTESDQFPESGWEIKSGVLTINKESGAGGIMTCEKFSDFELVLDFRLTPVANSGIKLFVDPAAYGGKGASIGPEFQILHDQAHPDAEKGREGNRKIGSLYDLIPAPEGKKVMPIGGWNQARILSRGKHVSFWLNGEMTVEFERGSEAWRKLVANSKYKRFAGFGEAEEGHILLQDHNDTVSYQNIKIRTRFD